jgi:hypothetical protein
MLPVPADRVQHRLLTPHGGDHQRKPQLGRQSGAGAGREQERRHPQPVGRDGVDSRVRPLLAGEVAEQLGDLLAEVRSRVLVSAQCAPDSVGEPDRATDPAGQERLEHTELLGDDQRPMVREHHPTRAHPDP